MSQHPQPAASRRWLGLAVISAAQFMVIMDTSIIGVALPKMQDDLGFSPGNLSWVFNAYVIAFGGLLLLGGKLSDVLGARRVFNAGWVLLIAGSLLAGVASGPSAELAGRAIQGGGSALIAPSALSLLFMLFGSSPRDLTKALAFYGAAAPAGGTAGVFLGGVITEYLSWPWVFFINIPIAAVIVALVPSVMPAGGRTTKSRIDLLGALTVTGGLAAAVYAVVEAPETGWGTSSTWLFLGVAAVLLAAFVALQAKGREPLLRLAIFRAPNLAAANLAQVLLGAAWIPMWFFLNLYLQQVLGYSAFPSGAALLPMTGMTMLAMIVLAPRVIAAFGPKTTTVAGLMLLAVGMGWLSLVDPSGSFTVDVLRPRSSQPSGCRSHSSRPWAPPSRRPAPKGGLASGIVNTSYQIGSALGLAIMTAVAAANGADDIGHPVALTEGYSSAFIGAALVAAVGAAASAAFLRRPAVTTEETPVDQAT